jgi:hypothetical protein
LRFPFAVPISGYCTAVRNDGNCFFLKNSKINNITSGAALATIFKPTIAVDPDLRITKQSIQVVAAVGAIARAQVYGSHLVT